MSTRTARQIGSLIGGRQSGTAKAAAASTVIAPTFCFQKTEKNSAGTELLLIRSNANADEQCHKAG